MLPSGLADIRDLLVPELQRRGLFHDEYEHATLRANLGLAGERAHDGERAQDGERALELSA
jgi:hypothetical protein